MAWMGLVVLSAEAEGFGNELRNYSDSLVEKLESWVSFSLKWIDGESDMINEEKIVSVHLSHTAESGHDGNERWVMPEHEKASLLPPGHSASGPLALPNGYCSSHRFNTIQRFSELSFGQ